MISMAVSISKFSIRYKRKSRKMSKKLCSALEPSACSLLNGKISGKFLGKTMKKITRKINIFGV